MKAYWGERHCRSWATTIATQLMQLPLALYWNGLYNRSVATTSKAKLKTLYTQLPAGAPVTSAQLADMGISADLAVHYARSGWLKRLARGVYSRPGDTLSLHPSLVVLQKQIAGLHVGGKTALEWYGGGHKVEMRPTTT